MLCNKCNKEIADNSMVCQFCGNVIYNHFDEVKENFVGMGATLATDHPTPTPQPVQQPIPEQNVQQVNQVEQPQVVQQQIPAEQTPQVQAQPNNVEQTVEDTTIVEQTTIQNKTPSALSIVITVISVLLCLYLIFWLFNGMEVSIINITVRILIIILVLLLSYNKLKHPNTPYSEGFKTAFIAINIIRLVIEFFYGGLSGRTFLYLSFWINTLWIPFLLYSAYYLVKKGTTFLVYRLDISNTIQQFVVTIGMSAFIYFITFYIYVFIKAFLTYLFIRMMIRY